jgi:tRNA A37 threonylcarbamoyladenosine dehydratase
MEPLLMPENEAACELDTVHPGITGINCAGFGSSVVVTASFGMVAAAHLLRKLADSSAGVYDSLA